MTRKSQWLLALTVVTAASLFAAGTTFGQVGPIEAQRRISAALEAEDTARAQQNAARRAAGIELRQRNLAMKEVEKTIVPLNKADLAKWKRNVTARYTYWTYEIKRDGDPVVVAAFNPKVGYVVNRNFQKNGLGWATLDLALEKHYGKDGLWSVPDIPGWSKAHIISGERQIADMKRQALDRARPKVVSKIADAVADGIVDQVGPKIGADIGRELNIDNPFSPGAVGRPAGQKDKGKKKPEGALLQFKRLDDDREKIRYGADDFMIYNFKDGSGFEVYRRHPTKDDWIRYEEVFTNLEGAVEFASNKANEKSKQEQ